MGESAVTLTAMGAIIAMLVVVGVIAFAKLRKADTAAREALSGIDVALTRQADLVPGLIDSMKGHASQESSILDTVTAARIAATRAAESGSVEEKAAADATLHRALSKILAAADRYPDVMASTAFTALRSELSDTENALYFARQFYNDGVREVNSLVQTIPWMFFSGFAGVKRRVLFQSPER